MPGAAGRRRVGEEGGGEARPGRVDVVIETGHLLRLAFGCPWRQTEGLLRSLVGVPDHTTLSRCSLGLALATPLIPQDVIRRPALPAAGLPPLYPPETPRGPHARRARGFCPRRSRQGRTRSR